MKKKYITNILMLSTLTLATGCQSNNTSESNQPSDSSMNSTSEENYPKLDYRLEDGETYNQITLKYEELTELTYNTISISGINNLAVNPYRIAYFDGQATIKNPTASLLNEQNILYTSAWYSRYTFNRQDACTEYVLTNEDGAWYVSSISNSSETFIPFNGAVLSLPSSHNALKVGDVISFTKGSIPTYDIGFYNQDGMRLAVKSANKVSWNRNGINLFDQNSISSVTPSQWEKISTINCYYDENKQSYIVDKFRLMNEYKKIYTNVHNGFMIGANLDADIEKMATVEGVRFNLHDTILVEENAAIHSQGYEFTLNGTNNYTLDSGNVLSFKIEKSTSNVTTSRWEVEIGIDRNNIIVSTGCHVDIPQDGYKLAIKTAENTTGEQLNLLLENVFTKASSIIISGNNLYINSTSSQRVNGLYRQVASLLEDTLDDLAYYNYSYDTIALNDIALQLENIKIQMDKIYSTENATLQYRLYTLMGEVNQQYYRILGATNRNEAAQVKSCWYINDYNGIDSNLESIQKQLDIIKASGTNEIIVGTISKGLANYNNSKVFNMNPSVSNKNYGKYGSDFLKAITSEAHLRNIKVIGCFNPFTDGIENNWPELKEAYALSINGETSVSTSQGAVKMLDPANSLVQEKIQETIQDIFESNPDLDGIHLDYIRFGADNNSIQSITGVTQSALDQFNQYCQENKYGYSIASVEDLRTLLKNNSDVFSKFNTFQANLITNTVKNIKDVCKKFDKPLSCAVADDSAYVKTWKCQDWGTWAKLGYVDALYLMDYYFDEYWVNYYFEDMLKATDNQTMLITGIDPSYAGLISEYYARLIKGGVTNIHSNGYAVFGSHTQNAKKDGWDLIQSSNWIDSLSPFDALMDTMKASGDLLLKRCDDIYIHYGNQTNVQKEKLENDLNTLYTFISGDNVSSCESVIDKLEMMMNEQYADNEANKRINEQLQYMHKIASMKFNVLKD